MNRSVSTLAALILDIHVLRRNNRRGKYNQMQDLDRKAQHPAQGSSSRDSTEIWGSDSMDVDRTHPSARVMDAPPRMYADQPRSGSNTDGYEVPQEQFNYDTGYHGGGGMGGEHRGQLGFEQVRTG